MRLGIIAAALVAAGCATQPEDIAANHVSVTEYKGYTCEELADEAGALNSKGRKLYESLDREADGDAAQMAVGMILFWPALFFLEGGDGADAEVYADLKGQMEAVQQASRRKQCKGVPRPLFG